MARQTEFQLQRVAHGGLEAVMDANYIGIVHTQPCGCLYSLRLSTELGSERTLEECAEVLVFTAKKKMAAHVCPKGVV